MKGDVVRIDARAAADGAGFRMAPASALVRFDDPAGTSPGATLLALLPPGDADRHPASAAARRLHAPSAVLIPGLVNAHTHLDLTHIGPRPFDVDAGEAGFAAWLGMIRDLRRQDGPAIRASVRLGIASLLATGTVAVGDIAGATRSGPCAEALLELGTSDLLGVGFLEFFAIGQSEQRGIAAAERVLRAATLGLTPGSRVRMGVQPHAPTTVGLAGYRWAAAASARDLPLCTHLAESAGERRFVAHGDGPIRALLEQVGVWEDRVLGELGHGRSPVAHLEGVMRDARLVCVHLNDVSDDDIGRLAAAGTRVVYCPRASAYFGSERCFGPHRYRDMLGAGITVALGTDSIVNLPPRPDGDAPALSVLDEARYLHARDGMDAGGLLAMVTFGGAEVLGLDASAFVFGTGLEARRISGLALVNVPDCAEDDGARAVMRSAADPHLVLPGGVAPEAGARSSAPEWHSITPGARARGGRREAGPAP